jgi:F-type H+-transporting ATPase subunit epsilon
MSPWKNVGMTYLKYADLCATHLRNALKEPAKTKAMLRSDMHARVMVWEGGKRGKPGAPRRAVTAGSHVLAAWPCGARWPVGRKRAARHGGASLHRSRHRATARRTGAAHGSASWRRQHAASRAAS